MEKTPAELTGWKAIAEFLGQPVAVVQRWAKSGMPVTRGGRNIVASRDDLKMWLGRETGMNSPARLSAQSEDGLNDDLRESLRAAKRK